MTSGGLDKGDALRVEVASFSGPRRGDLDGGVGAMLEGDLRFVVLGLRLFEDDAEGFFCSEPADPLVFKVGTGRLKMECSADESVSSPAGVGGREGSLSSREDVVSTD